MAGSFGMIYFEVFKVGVPLYLPTSSPRGFQLLLIPIKTWLVSYFNFSHFNRCAVVSHYGFSLHFPDD